MFNRGHLSFITTTFVLMASPGLCWAKNTSIFKERAPVVAEASTQPAPRSTAENAAPSQENTQQEAAANAQAVEREAWRKSMARHALPKNGCFHASYPAKEWKEVPCGTAPPIPFRPQVGGGKPAVVGGGGATDFSAQVAGLINTADGSFNSITGMTNATSNNFSLQLNSNTFQTAACNNVAGCVGWEQFVFSNIGGGCNPGPACVFIQVWLIGFGPVCPAGGNWLQTPLAPNDCFKNTASASVNTQPIANLVNLTLTGTAVANGQDTAVIGTPGGNLNAIGQDNVLNLAQRWNTAEFNAFGNGNAAQLAFNVGTTVVVKTTAIDGSGNPPACLQQSFTGETNNLNLANVTGKGILVCCPYGGASPAIEFMETNAMPPHTAICGPTALIGDPHITTVDGGHYDFQAAGEFVSLRDSDGSEVQTRQRPVSTTFIGTDGHDGLTTCVSLNSAVAARVGEHRVTYEPNLSGVPDPSGLQLRIDGLLTVPGPAGIDLRNGGRVVKSTGGNLEVDFPDGKTLFVTPGWWPSQNQWYLNVDVTHLGLVSGDVGTFPRGIVGPIPNEGWLPGLPNGTSMGPMPGPIPERYDALYHKFADAWRVTDKDSLFDYAPGTSTGTFTMKNWPLQHPPCVVPETKPVEPASEAVAQAACRRVIDPNRHADCVFDVRATGNPGFARTYLDSQRILADSTTIGLTDDAEPSQLGEPVTFTAFVLANGSAATRYPSGTVQFAVDGANVGTPVEVDAKGRATWETSRLKVGTHRVTASFAPSEDSVFLPSISVEKIHVVRRCPCEDEREHKGKEKE